MTVLVAEDGYELCAKLIFDLKSDPSASSGAIGSSTAGGASKVHGESGLGGGKLKAGGAERDRSPDDERRPRRGVISFFYKYFKI